MIETVVEAANALFYFVCVYAIIDRLCDAYEKRNAQTMIINQKAGDDK